MRWKFRDSDFRVVNVSNLFDLVQRSTFLGMRFILFGSWFQSARALTQVGFVALGLLVGSDLAAEEQPPRFDYGEIGGVFAKTGERDGYVDFGALSRTYRNYANWKSEVVKNTGFSWLIEDRLISQWGRNSEIHDNELNLIGRYEFARQSPATWSLNVWGQFANTLGGKTGSVFQSDLGVLSPLNGGNSGPGKNNQILQMLAVEYVSPAETFRFQAGKLALRTLVNLNRYAHGDSESFFSPMLGNNPVVPYTALLGLGVFGQFRADTWYVSGLVRAPDTELGLSTDAWRSGAREYVVEAALTPTIKRLGYGEYRLTWSLLEASGALPRVETVSLSADQDFGDRLGGFFRYADVDTTFRDFDRRIAAGVIIKKPFGFAHDQFGVGTWHGRPTNAVLRSETGIELFYRAQISPALQLTPDVQIVLDPANSTRSSEVIFGLRLRLDL
jgi:carbohydrate-selective porin (OprB family)